MVQRSLDILRSNIFRCPIHKQKWNNSLNFISSEKKAASYSVSLITFSGVVDLHRYYFVGQDCRSLYVRVAAMNKAAAKSQSVCSHTKRFPEVGSNWIFSGRLY